MNSANASQPSSHPLSNWPRKAADFDKGVDEGGLGKGLAKGTDVHPLAETIGPGKFHHGGNNRATTDVDIAVADESGDDFIGLCGGAANGFGGSLPVGRLARRTNSAGYFLSRGLRGSEASAGSVRAAGKGLAH